MRKILAVILSFGLIFSLSACGGNTPSDKSVAENTAETSLKNITKEEYEKMTAEDLLKNIKDIKNVTAEEYAEVCETLKFVNIKADFELEKNITDEAIKIIRDSTERAPLVSDWVHILWKNDAPQVKGRALRNASVVYGTDPEFLAEVEENLKTEDDSYIIYWTLRTLPSTSFKKDEIVARINELTNHENETLSKYAKKLIENDIK